MHNAPIRAAGEAMPAEPVSQRANRLLAAFVAIEAEQHRIAGSGPSGRDGARAERVTALGETAIAIADELAAIESRSGNADLAAALVLVKLMFQHDYADLARVQWGEDDRERLAVLAALAGATTGEVRRHAAAVLATKGIVVPDEASDPTLDLVRRNAVYRAAYAAAPDAIDPDGEGFAAANDAAAGIALCADPPMPTTAAGAFAAIRYVAEDCGFVQPPHARILHQALAFLEPAGAVGAALPAVEMVAEAADPCLAFMTAWDDMTECREAIPGPAGEAFHATHCDLYERAAFDGRIPNATTAAGAAMALRKVLSFDPQEQDIALIGAALAFLERESRS